MGSPYITQSFILHTGVKGMKWGVRRAAKKDAKEYAKAKMFYGEGAGTRRKLIKAKVNQRSKDPNYKSEFERNLAGQDMAKRSDQARRERSRKDTRKSIAKTTRGVKNTLLGNARYASVAGVAIGGAVIAAHKTGTDKVLLAKGKQAFKTATTSPQFRHGVQVVKNMFKQ